MDGPFPRIYNYTQQQRSLPKGHFDWGLKSSIDSAMPQNFSQKALGPTS